MFATSVVLTVLTASCIAVPAPALAPTTSVEACSSTTWSSWNQIPSCDLDGSQTWVLADEASDITFTDPAAECDHAGGVYAVSVTDPFTLYCIDVDY